MVAFVQKVRDIMEHLIAHWSHDKYTKEYAPRAGDAADQGVQFKPSEFTAILHSPKIRLYMSMILRIFRTLENLAGWFEGCACHPRSVFDRRKIAEEMGADA